MTTLKRFFMLTIALALVFVFIGCVDETTTAAPVTTGTPTTTAVTTEAPTTQAPTTEAPTTLAPTTMAPTTVAPTTAAPTTVPVTTEPPTTEAPTTVEVTTAAPEEFTVSFEVNGGSAVAPIVDVVDGSTISEPGAPVKAEHNFLGWYKEATFDTVWDFAVDIVTADITLYAKWEVATYTVTFAVDGSAPIEAISGLLTGATVTEPTPVPTKTLATFLGWYKEATFDTLWNFATDTVTQDTTIYAKWDIPGTPVSTLQEFYDMTYSGSEDKFYLTQDLDFAAFTWPVLADNGVNFQGEFDGRDHVVSNIAVTGEGYGGVFQRVSGATIKNLVLDTVSVDVTGRAGVLIGRVENNGATLENIKIIDSLVKGTDGNGVGILIGMAAYEAHIDKIIILSSSAYSTNKNVGLLIGRADRITTVADVYIANSTATTTSTSTDSGVGFIGYTNNADANLTINRVVVENAILDGRGAGFLGHYKYGAMTANNVLMDVSFPYEASDEQSGFLGKRAATGTTDPVLTNVFAHLIGNSMSGDGVVWDPAYVLAGLNELTASWWTTNQNAIVTSELWNINEMTGIYTMLEEVILPKYTVTFDVGGAAAIDPLPNVAEGSLISAPAEPTKAGFAFTGWYKEATHENLWEFATDTVLADVTLYAGWIAIYDVTFESNSGSAVDPILDVEEGSLVTEPEDPVREGYTFTGWYKEVGLTTLWDFAVDTVTADVTLYAGWEEILVTYTVTFEVYEGSAVPELTEVYEGTTISAPVAPTKADYAFAGWFKEATYDTPWNFETDTVVANITLHAKWLELFTVSFNSNGGTAVSAIEAEDGSLISAPAAPTKDGYEFEGWYKNEELTLVWDFAVDTVTSDTLLYANWVIPTYTVSYNEDNGTAVSDLTEVSLGSTVSEPAAPTKAGATFLGWYKEATFDTAWNFTTDTVTANTTLYAKWDIVGFPVQTAEEFYSLATTGAISGASGTVFYLANDIDFTSFTYTVISYNFTRTLNGNNKTLSNITITAGIDRSGIFQRAKTATIYDLIIDNAQIQGVGRAGILVGELDGADTTITNITIKNSSVSGNSSNGVGGLVGYAKSASQNINVSNIVIQNTTVTNANTGAGGLFGMADGSLINIADINMLDVDVTAKGRAGGVFGEIKGAATANISITRVVYTGEVKDVSDGYVAGVIGRPSVDGLTINVSDIVISGNITATGSNVGHVSGDRSVSESNVYMIDVTVVGTLNKQVVDPAYVIDSGVTTIDGAWWTTNINNIASSLVWEYNATSHYYDLIR